MSDQEQENDLIEQVEEKNTREIIEIDDLSKWKSAEERTHEVSLETLQGVMHFNVHPIMYKDFMSLSEKFKRPEPPRIKVGGQGQSEPNFQDEEYQMEMMIYSLEVDLYMVDTALVDFKFPGSNSKEKLKWALENFHRQGEINQLYNEIASVSGRGTSKHETESIQDHVIKSIDDWKKLNTKKTLIKFEYDKFEYVFSMSGISGSDLKEIEDTTRIGPPPKEPVKMPGEGPRRMIPKLNYENPSYVQKKKEMQNVRHVLLLEQCSGLKVPGETGAEKVEWLQSRPVYEVTQLITFLDGENQGYGGNLDFL